MTLTEFIDRLVEAEIEVTIKKVNQTIIYDCNLQAKSHLYLYQEDGQIRIRMRYGVDEPLQDWDALMQWALKGMHGRDFMNSQWFDLLKKEGYEPKDPWLY